MKKILFFLMFVLLCSLTYAIGASTTSYDINIFQSTGTIMEENLAVGNLTSGSGQITIGNKSTSSYNVQFGIYYMGSTPNASTNATNASVPTTVTPPSSGGGGGGITVVPLLYDIVPRYKKTMYATGTIIEESFTIVNKEQSHGLIIELNTDLNVYNKRFLIHAGENRTVFFNLDNTEGHHIEFVNIVIIKNIYTKAHDNYTIEYSITDAIPILPIINVTRFINMSLINTTIIEDEIEENIRRTLTLFKHPLFYVVGLLILMLTLLVVQQLSKERDISTRKRPLYYIVIYILLAALSYGIYLIVKNPEIISILVQLYRHPVTYILLLSILILTIIVIQQWSKRESVNMYVKERKPVAYIVLFIILSIVAYIGYLILRGTNIIAMLRVFYNHPTFYIVTIVLGLVVVFFIYRSARKNGGLISE